jgi:hypothetical protein
MVTSLNHLCSPWRRQGILLFWPITRFRVIATIAFTSEEVASSRRQLPVEEAEVEESGHSSQMRPVLQTHFQFLTLDCDRRLDCGMRIVTDQVDVFVAKIP